MLKRTISNVGAELERCPGESTTLNDWCQNEAPVFHRKEIVIGELLGTGGSAVVYEIKNIILNEDISCQLTKKQQDARQNMAESATYKGESQYAIKLLQADLASKQRSFYEAARNLVIEANFCSSLDHPGVQQLKGISFAGIKAFDNGEHDSFFIITERLTETLDDRIKRWGSQPNSNVSLKTKVKVAEQLAEVLQYLHDNRIVFRDLKPSNIGFSPKDDSLRLFDFGLSRRLPKGRSSGNVYVMSDVGTCRYMAPEVVRQFPYNCQADVYGWSMIFWQMLYLIQPYAEMSPEEHEASVIESSHRPEISSDCPESIRLLLQDSWVESPYVRLSMDDVCGDLVMILDELDEKSGSGHDLFEWKAAVEKPAERDRKFSFSSLTSTCNSTDSIEDDFISQSHCLTL